MILRALAKIKIIWNNHAIEGDSPVFNLIQAVSVNTYYYFSESGCLGLQPKVRGKSHVTLNIDEKPIANK